jgi:cyclophilin family peptidyl-prolyl cis-trans isomerase
MMLTNLLLTLPVLGGPEVDWKAPTNYLVGGAYKVSLEITAPASGTVVAGWLLTPAAFLVDGKPLADRDERGTIQLPKGARLTLDVDLGPFLKDVKKGFKLGYAKEIVEGGPVEVSLLKPAPEGLDFMQVPLEDLSKYNVLLQTNRGDMRLEMWPDVAPNHVRNYLDLAYTGFYDGVIFHRVMPGFMIQGGDPTGSGSGNGPRMLDAEFSDKFHDRGVLSMARTNEENSASCQFFICHAPAAHLNGQYSAFGKLISGEATLDAIANTPAPGTRPTSEQKIIKAFVVLVDGKD